MDPTNPRLSASEYGKIDPLSQQTFEALAEQNDLIQTSCGHKFSAVALAVLMNREHNCPECHQHIDPTKNILVIKQAAGQKHDLEDKQPVLQGAQHLIPDIMRQRSHWLYPRVPPRPAQQPSRDPIRDMNGDRTPDQALEEAIRLSLADAPRPEVRPAASTQTAPLTEADSGKVLHLHVGDRIEIKLSGNPSTGYVWQAATRDPKISCESSFLQLRHACGAPGTYTFTVTALQEGETTLRLEYQRPWEGGAVQTFTLKLFIDQGAARATQAVSEPEHPAPTTARMRMMHDIMGWSTLPSEGRAHLVDTMHHRG